MFAGYLDLLNVGLMQASLEARFTPRLLDACDLILRDAITNPSSALIVALARRCIACRDISGVPFLDSDLHCLSWAARTLFELKVLTAYIAASPDNLERFKKEMYVDANDALRRAATASFSVALIMGTAQPR
jgi:hypothetical protein